MLRPRSCRTMWACTCGSASPRKPHRQGVGLGAGELGQRAGGLAAPAVAAVHSTSSIIARACGRGMLDAISSRTMACCAASSNCRHSDWPLRSQAIESIRFKFCATAGEGSWPIFAPDTG